MAYQVLARAWRPQTFADLMGQDAVVRTLRNALTSETLGHAYLFSGLRGVGKTTVARLLAKAVNCQEGPTPDPCGECQACNEIVSGSSLDVVELDGASNRGIDDVRELRELLRYRPTRDRYRVIIIDEVHMLTREAFNALLKSLEEPPPYILFIFATTERHKVPGTILSRCQQLEFRPVANELIVERLTAIAGKEGFAMTPGAAGMIARAAEGSVRDALSLLDQLRAFSGNEVDEESVAAVLGVPPFEQIARLIEQLAAGDTVAALGLLREELVAGHDCTVLFQETGRMLRTLLHLSLDPSLEPSLTDEHRSLLEGIAGPLGSSALARMLGLWLEQEPLLRDSGNRELALEVACLRLSRWPAVQQLEALLSAGGQLRPGTPAALPPAGGAAAPPASPGGASGGPPPSSLQAAPAEEAYQEELSPEPSSLKERLSSALWDQGMRQLAGAVDVAEVSVDGAELRLSFSTEQQPLARFVESEDGRPGLVTVLGSVSPDLETVRVEVNGQGPTGNGNDGGGGGVNGNGNGPTLREQALGDPMVALAQRVLGGEIARVIPDEARP